MFFNIPTAVICVSAASLLASPQARAEAPPPNLKTLDIKSICAGSNARYMLARSIIDNYKISSKMLDWNDNGVFEPRRMVTEIMCAGDLAATQETKCYGAKPEAGAAGIPVPSADNLAQAQMVQDVNKLFRDSQNARGDVKLGDDTKASITFRKVRSVSALDIRRQPLLGLGGGFSTAAQVFSEAPTFYDISCHVAPDKSGIAAGRPDRSGQSRVVEIDAAAAPPLMENLADRFRLRGKTDDLWIGRDADGFAGLSGASLAVVNDRIAQKSSFDTHLVLGYALPAWQNGGTVLDSIPYLKYDRDYIDGVNPTSSNNVNNIAVGLQQRLTFPLSEEFYSAIIAQPQFVDSLRSGAQVLSVRLAYEPEPLVPFLGFVAQTPIPNLWATAYARGVMNYYEVTQSANDGSLTSGKSFWHAGGQVGGVLLFKDGPFSGLSFPIDYTYLYGVSGPYKSVELLQVGINYTLPKTKYVTVGLSYTSGRNLDTFELQKVYKASLGLKY